MAIWICLLTKRMCFFMLPSIDNERHRQQRSIWSRLWFFQWSCMDVRVGLWRKLSTKKLMLLNCGVGEDSLESLGLQGVPTSPSWRRSVLGVHWKDWCWSWNSNILSTWCEELTHWKRPWCWEGLGSGGEGDDRGWDGWMASLTRWAWVWVNSGSWWWTGKPGELWFMGLQRVGHDWATELNWTDSYWQRMGSFKLRSQIRLIMWFFSNWAYDFGWEFKQIFIFNLYKDW